MPSRTKSVRTIIQKKSKKTSRNTINPPSSAQVYMGPLILPHAKLQAATTTIRMTQTATISSSSSVINTVISLALNQFDTYTSTGALWDEWRMLSCRCAFVPISMNTEPTGLLGGTIAMCIDRDSNNALTTLSGAFDYESCKIFASNSMSKITYRMTGSEDAQFASTSSYSPAYIKMYSSVGTASATYGYVFCEALVQFRGRL